MMQSHAKCKLTCIYSDVHYLVLNSQLEEESRMRKKEKEFFVNFFSLVGNLAQFFFNFYFYNKRFFCSQRNFSIFYQFFYKKSFFGTNFSSTLIFYQLVIKEGFFGFQKNFSIFIYLSYHFLL